MDRTPFAALSPVEFQKQRRRMEAPAALSPISGYGPDGQHTMYVPTGEASRRWSFVDGKPVLSVQSTFEFDEETSRLREVILRTMRTFTLDVRMFVECDAAVLVYSARLLSMVYDLDDDDLTQLHASGSTAWIRNVCAHAIGGDNAVRQLAEAPPIDAAEEIPPPGFVDEVEAESDAEVVE